MRVSIRKSDGKILEAQSNDDAPMDALINNAKSQGYQLEDIEFTVLNDSEVEQRIKEQNESTQDYATKRRKLYEKRGATIDNLIIALFENNTSEIDRLKKIRSQVKQEIPKE